MRLIDADALEDAVNDMDYDVISSDWDRCDGFSAANVFNVIACAPTVDPVKHAHWEIVGLPDMEGLHHEIYICSHCKGQYIGQRKRNYCSDCGAKMD